MNVLKIITKQHTKNIQGGFFSFIPVYLSSSSHRATLLPLRIGAVSSWQKENSRHLHCLVLADVEPLGRLQSIFI